METTKITVKTQVSAELNKVWNYYTQPEHITKWNFASTDWCCPSAENDLRLGGKYKARMEAKDGSFGFDFEAVYTDVVDKSSFTYKMTDGRVCTTHFAQEGKETIIEINFDAENQNPVNMQRDGWQAILNNFKAYCEAQN